MTGDNVYLQYNLKLMRTIGLWPLDTDSRLLLAANTLYTFLLVVSLAVVSVGQVVEIFVSPNITSMASAVDLATLTASALFKMVYMIWYRKYFQRLVSNIDSTFVQHDFFLGRFDMKEWAKFSKTCIFSYIVWGAPMLMVCFGLPPYFMSTILQDDSDEYLVNRMLNYSYAEIDNTSAKQSSSAFDGSSQSGTESLLGINHDEGELNLANPGRKFPINCWLPFDATWSPIYEIVYLLELIPLLASGHLYLVSDSFFFMMIYLICGQLELLKVSFRGLQEKFISVKKEKEISDQNVQNIPTTSIAPARLRDIQPKEKAMENEMNEAIIKCVELHRNIIEIITDLDSLLRSMVIVDFCHAVISLSFAMLQTITSNAIFEWVQMCVFIAVCIIHQFLNNFFAEILTQKQLSVAEAVYETPWVEGTDLHKMAVYMALNQANHPIRLSGWKMYHLGLETFVEFMKLLTSYFLVLQSLHADESRRGRST